MGIRVGAYVQELRQQKDLSIRQLAEQTGFSHAHISMVEKGQREASINALYSLMQALDGDFVQAMFLLAIDSGIPEESLPKQVCAQTQWPAIVTNSG